MLGSAAYNKSTYSGLAGLSIWRTTLPRDGSGPLLKRKGKHGYHVAGLFEIPTDTHAWRECSILYVVRPA